MYNAWLTTIVVPIEVVPFTTPVVYIDRTHNQLILESHGSNVTQAKHRTQEQAEYFIKYLCQNENQLQQELCVLTHQEMITKGNWDINQINNVYHIKLSSQLPTQYTPQPDQLSVTEWMRIFPIY